MERAIRPLGASLVVALLGGALASQTALCTSFAGTNVVGTGSGTVYFDLTVLAVTDRLITAFDINTNAAAGTHVMIDVYKTAPGGTYAGSQTVVGAWTRIGSGFGTAAGGNMPTRIDVPDFVLTAGSQQGIALHHKNVEPYYVIQTAATTNVYADADLRLSMGSVTGGAAGVGPLYNPRNFQGCVYHAPYAGQSIADFNADRVLIGPSQTVSFSDRSISRAVGGIVLWDWDLDGDGVFGDATIANPTTTYAACGPKNVSLRIVDASGAPTTTKTNYVDVTAPVTAFTNTSTGGPNPAPITMAFTDTSTRAPTSWQWDFDDDGIVDSTLQNPTHVFSNAALQAVTLTTGNACGTTSALRLLETRPKVLCTVFNWNFGGSVGGAVYFDVNVVNPAGITINSIDLNSSAVGNVPVSLDVSVKRGTRVGFETNASAWVKASSIAATGRSRGPNVQTYFDVEDLCLPPGTSALALVLIGSAHRYTSMTAITVYQNSDLTMLLGAASNAPFGTPIQNRVANVCLGYTVGMPAGSFTLAEPGCLNSTGNVARLVLRGGAVPTSGQPMVFDVTNAPPSAAIAGLLIGFVQYAPAIDLGLIGGPPGCKLMLDPVVTAPLTVDGVGAASFTLSLPIASEGLTFFAEGLFADFALVPLPALPVVSSDGYRGVVGC